MIESAEEFIRLRASQDPRDYARAAQEPATHEVWLAVIRDHPDLRRWVAHNKTLSSELLRILAADVDPAVRWVVAMRRAAPPEVLRALAADPDVSVRGRVATNAKTPEVVLRQMTQDPDETVRAAAQERVQRFR